LYEFLKEWQTLITGFLAIAAALIAAQPVRRQLSRMNIQASVMARDVLAKRLSATELRRARTKKHLAVITTDFIRQIYTGEGSEPEFNAEWAFAAESMADRTITALSAYQESKADSVSIDKIRKKVLRSARKLSKCLSAIHAPDSTDLDDPEYALSETQKNDIRKRAANACTQLPDKISAVERYADLLDQAYSSELEKLRKRIREIDDLIVRDEVEKE
jgi:hypothetical protein